MISLFRQRILTLFIGIFLSFTSIGAPDSYPLRPITVVVPFPPGGGTDIAGRLLAEKLSTVLKQSVIVENRPGASANIGAQYVSNAQPNGYTLLFSTGGTHGVNPFLYKNIGYDPVKDFEPIIWATVSPNIIAVNPALPFKTLKELIDYAKSRPGELSSAAPGQGSIPHMAGELFKKSTGINIPHIPYKGSAAAITDVIGGHVPILFDSIGSTLPFVQTGKLRALAVTGKSRSSAAPEIPTVAETIPGFEASGWFALYAPAGTPRHIILLLNQAANQALEMPDVKKRYSDVGSDVVGGPPEKLRDQVKQEMAKWSELIRTTGIKAE